jgi:hypothetical protein
MDLLTPPNLASYAVGAYASLRSLGVTFTAAFAWTGRSAADQVAELDGAVGAVHSAITLEEEIVQKQ